MILDYYPTLLRTYIRSLRSTKSWEMLENLLKTDFIDVVNSAPVRRGDAPIWTKIPQIRVEDVADFSFDVEDPKNDSTTIKRAFGEGTASYVNGKPDNPYVLRFVCYDEYMHQFVFDDGEGHPNKSMFKQHKHMADFIVYDTSDNHVWIIIHELSTSDVCNKRGTAKLQLSYTIDLLCRSERIKNFIKDIPNKWCILSARDERVLQTPSGMADAFMNAYEIIPKPLKFQFGPMKRLGFIGYETSKVILE